ncbi:hypothetical protein WA026_022444 [Henosepilachna vigintioctopunctata]|uniref:Uncharacterized protein n=1 Tax=Henosepilachna vigintioctopunctata TaxID=420089 RepID=A0AAW1U499_9CUCU
MYDISYPKKLINKLLYTIPIDLFENSTSIQSDSVNSTNEGPVTSENKQYFSLPLIKELTPKIANVIKQSQEIILAHKQLKPERMLFSQLKDRTKPLDRSHVIYEIPYQDCSLKYIGQKQRNLKS